MPRSLEKLKGCTLSRLSSSSFLLTNGPNHMKHHVTLMKYSEPGYDYKWLFKRSIATLRKVPMCSKMSAYVTIQVHKNDHNASLNLGQHVILLELQIKNTF